MMFTFGTAELRRRKRQTRQPFMVVQLPGGYGTSFEMALNGGARSAATINNCTIEKIYDVNIRLGGIAPLKQQHIVPSTFAC